jgi:Xaa-Pro aminopeptidase
MLIYLGLTNLRGNDIQNCPVFFAYAILNIDFLLNEFNLLLFAKNDQSIQNNLQIRDFLSKNKITILSYESFYDYFNKCESKYIFLDKSTNNYIYQKLCDKFKDNLILTEFNIVENLKCLKNNTELQGIRNCHKRDAVSIIRYFAWLEEELNKNIRISEYEGALKLQSLRKQSLHYLFDSFETISSSGPNSAVIHYKPKKESSLEIKKNQIYLLDSGGCYLDGTTDTTRTVHFSTPTEKEKNLYTRVLLGNLSLERLKFQNMTGSQLDSVARQFLLQIGLNYGHGTGHGVGHCLNVHEGPHSISPMSNVKLKERMVVTNEPGVYIKDEFGFRIENVLLIRSALNQLYFENVTRVPYEINLFDLSLISADMLQYINTYHQLVYEDISPLLREMEDSYALDFLKRKTRKIMN